MLKKTVYCLFCIAFVFVICTSASAEVKPSTFYVSPYAGGYQFDDELNLDDRPVYGLRFGYDITKHLGVELSGDYIYTKYELDVPGTQTSHVFNYRLNGVVNLLPEGRLVPFLLAGVGGRKIHGPGSASNDFTANYGAGLKYYFMDDVALRADVSQTHSFDHATNDFDYTLGLAFYFGGPENAMPVADAGPAPEMETEENAFSPAPVADEKEIVLAFEDVHFNFDQSALTEEAKTILDRNIQVLKDNPRAKVRIAGYTSASGTHIYNQGLSERRAKAVENHLIQEGIVTPERMTKIGYGETNPAEYEEAPKNIDSDEAKANMRVLFEIIVK